jgi:hypothetical protein
VSGQLFSRGVSLGNGDGRLSYRLKAFDEWWRRALRRPSRWDGCIERDIDWDTLGCDRPDRVPSISQLESALR